MTTFRKRLILGITAGFLGLLFFLWPQIAIILGVPRDSLASAQTGACQLDRGGQGGNGAVLPEGVDMEKYVADIERHLLQAALAQSNGVQTRAADVLKISYRSFRHLVKKYDLYGFIEHVPLKGVRRAIAKAMVKSVYTAPHVTAMDEADVTDLLAAHAKAKGVLEASGARHCLGDRVRGRRGKRAHELAAKDDRDAIAQGEDLGQIPGDQQDTGPGPLSQQLLPNFHRRADVQPVSRMLGDDQVRVLRQLPRQDQLLQVAARQLPA